MTVAQVRDLKKGPALIRVRPAIGSGRSINATRWDREARGVRFGRPRKLDAHQRQEALERLAKGETLVDVARTGRSNHYRSIGQQCRLNTARAYF
jgi:hypothetical protein